MKRIFLPLLLLFTAQIVLSQQVFTSSGSYTVPTGVTSLTIEVVGAGGNGAGNGGGGGGGGGYAKGIFAVTPGTVLTVTIGNGGGGSTGGSTSVTGLISATGGGNGTTVSNPTIGGGGAGGAGSNGNVVNRTGGNGGGAYWTYFGGGGGGAGGPAANGSNGGNTIAYNGTNCLTPGGAGGAGGGAPGGNGGKGAGFTDNQCNTADPAAAGANYGGGGGGGNGNSSPAQTGAGGYCKIDFGPCTAPNAPGIALSSLTVCSGKSATLSASGTGTVNWYTNSTGGTSVATGSTYITSPLTTTTTYYAEALTCTTSAQRTAFTVTVFPLPVITLTASPGPYCVNKPYTLTANGGITYTWSSGASGSVQIITPQNTPVFPPIVVGADANGCLNTASIVVGVSPQPSIVIVSTGTFCAGQTVTFTAFGANSYSWSNGLQTASISVAVFSPTVFTVTGTNPAGCSNTAAISQTVLPNLPVSISGHSIICKGEQIILIASGAATYSWTGIGAGYNLTVSPISTTVYTVTGFNALGCSGVFTHLVLVSNCTGIKELTAFRHVVAYPNPSTGIFTIQSEEDVTLYVYSVSGQMLQTVSLDKKNKWTQQLEALPKGIYFLKDEKGKQGQMLVVE